MLAVQGPLAREIVQAISDCAAAAADDRRDPAARRAATCSCAAPATRARMASSCCARPRTRRRLWDEIVRRGAVPAGLGARDTLRLEACFHLYGNDLSVERGPIEAGLGWCCKEDTDFIGADAVRAAARARTGRAARRVRDRRPGDRAPGQPGAGRRRGHQRHLLPVPADRHRARLRARRARAAGHRAARSTFVARCAAPWSRTSRSTERTREWRRPATPRICCITPSTTGRASRTIDPIPPARGPRHHLVRAGRARRGRVLRAAGGRHDAHQGCPLRRGRVGEGRLGRRRARSPERSSRSTRRWRRTRA